MYKISYLNLIMKLLCVIFIGLFTVIYAAEGWGSLPQETEYEEGATPTEWGKWQANSPDAVFEDGEHDSFLIEAQYFPPLPPLPPPQAWTPPPSFCSYGESAFCHTMNGNVCNSFIINYPIMTIWLSSCIQIGSTFRSCVEISGPRMSTPSISSGCFSTGTPCLCSFFGHYEAGNIL